MFVRKKKKLNLSSEYIATEEQVNDFYYFRNKSEKNKDLEVFVYKDRLFAMDNNVIYTYRLPLTTEENMVANPYWLRDRNRINYIAKHKHEPWFCPTIIIPPEKMEEIRIEAIRRAEKKSEEHKRGDNNGDVRRIETGIMGEVAVELFTGKKATDFSEPSGCSKKFDVNDVGELGVGVKCTREENLAYIVEPTQRCGQILTCWRNKRIENSDAVCIRGFATKDAISDRKNQSYDAIKDNKLLGKCICYDTKTAIMPQESSFYSPTYSVNEMTENNKGKYTAANFSLGKNVNLLNPSKEFIAKIEKLREENDSMMCYVDTTILDIKGNYQIESAYDDINNPKMQALKAIAMEYRIAIVLYNQSVLAQMDRAGVLGCFCTPINDPYFIGELE